MANVTQEELDTRLAELAEGLGLSVKEYVEAGFLDLDTYSLDKSAILSRLDALDRIDASDSIESLAERVEALRDLFEDAEGDLVQGILTSIATNTGAISTLTGDETVEGSVAKAVKDAVVAEKVVTDALDARLVVEETKSADAKVAADQVRVELDAVKVESAQSTADVAVLKGDDTVEGSVAKTVKDAVAAEEARTKGVTGLRADLTTDEKGTIVGAINEVDAHADEALAQIAVLNGDDTVEGSVAKAVLDATGGDITDLSDRMTAVEELASDAVIAAASAGSAADVANNSIAILNGDETVEGSVAKAVLDATGGDISDLSDRMTAVEAEDVRIASILDDTTDADDNIVKGVVTKLDEAAQAIVAEAAARVADVEARLAEAKAYTDEYALCTPQIQALDICGHVNKFRGALGLGANTCDGSNTSDGEAL